MTSSHRIFADAQRIADNISQMAVGRGHYEPERYETSIDLLRQSILELSAQGEFGFVSELTHISMHLLSKEWLDNSRLRHPIEIRSLMHHVDNLPSAMNGLVNDIGINHTLNLHIVRSIIRARDIGREGDDRDLAEILKGLAVDQDVRGWSELVEFIIDLEHAEGISIALKTLSLFEPETIRTHMPRFEKFSDEFENFRPLGFRLDIYFHKTDEFKLFDNLMSIGAQSTVQHLIAHSTVHFDRELKLHLYRDRYGFQPGSDQLNEWANQCLMGEHGHYRNVIKSLYPYFLSTETEPFEMVAGLSPDMVVDILAMEGSEMASGTLKFDDRKVGQMLSATLKQALTNGDGLTRYERQIPKATLMKSQYYRGQVLSDQLGL